MILHRPFPSPESTAKLSDIEFEALENTAISKIRNYLQEMDLPQYYVDKMISTASRDGYMPTSEDIAEHSLPEFAASIEELLLSKCDTVASVAQEDYDTYVLRAIGRKARFNRNVLDRLTEKTWEVKTCEEEQLVQLRIAAWIRESILKVNSECSSNSSPVASLPRRSATEGSNSKHALEKSFDTPSAPKETSPISVYFWLIQMELELDPRGAIDNSELGDCQKQALHQIALETLDRWRHAKLGDTAPTGFVVDTSILDAP